MKQPRFEVENVFPAFFEAFSWQPRPRFDCVGTIHASTVRARALSSH